MMLYKILILSWCYYKSSYLPIGKNNLKTFYIFRIKSAKNATVGKNSKKGKAKGKQSKDGESFGKFYSFFFVLFVYSYPAVVAWS